MAHWAKIENGIITQITVGNNDDPNEGYDWLIENIGGTWVKTSYNTYGGTHKEGGMPFRKNYAVIGGVYDEERDAFIPPKPEDFIDENGESFTFVLNEETCLWDITKK